MKKVNLGILTALVLGLVLLAASGCAGSAPTGSASKESAAAPKESTSAPAAKEATPVPKESTSAPAAKPAESKPAAQKDPLQALYEAAKAEGEVAFWGPTDPDEMKALGEAFNKRFPGVQLKSFEITAGELVQRITTEAQAGKVSADAAEGSVSTILPLLDRGLIQPYSDWTQVFKDINPKAVIMDGKGLTWYNLAHPIGYNTNLLKKEEVPKTWDDLLDPKWKDGKILVEARAKTFGYLGLRWGEEKMVDYVTKLAAQKPVFTKGGTTTIQQLAAGEAPLAVGGYAYKIMWYARDKKAPVDFIDTTTPMGASHFVTFAIKGAKHPNAAKLFAGWLVTPEALKILSDTSFKGQLIPGSTSVEYQRLAKNNVEIIAEGPESAEKANSLEEKCAKALGAVK